MVLRGNDEPAAMIDESDFSAERFTAGDCGQSFGKIGSHPCPDAELDLAGLVYILMIACAADMQEAFMKLSERSAVHGQCRAEHCPPPGIDVPGFAASDEPKQRVGGFVVNRPKDQRHRAGVDGRVEKYCTEKDLEPESNLGPGCCSFALHTPI